MKIDEPSTPYNSFDHDLNLVSGCSSGVVSGWGNECVGVLVSRLAAAEGVQPRFMKEEEEEEESSEEEEEQLSPEEQAKKKHFQMMRKMHYNEGMNIKMARQLIASELQEEEDEDEEMREDAEMEDVSESTPQDGQGLRAQRSRAESPHTSSACPSNRAGPVTRSYTQYQKNQH
ncbi:hypothetical protein JZ751_027388 [Albula glossodonta]|uniref:Protein phosphatase inhibitor 2 n=1 Tax=Albula glossodonta TaxID=121402 RepID=A0A8T2MR54_9TELE|nr:hypothetical protein JZ751_027388 [Albula glossodonta]